MRRSTLLLLASASILGAVFATLPLQENVEAQTTARAGGDRYFLKIDGVEGEITETGHAGSIAVRAIKWHQSRPLSTSAVVTPEKMTLTLWTDKSMPHLLRKAGALERIPKITLTARNTVGQDYLKWIFSDAFITGFGTESAIGDNRPSVTIDVVFAKTETEYRQQLQNGGLGSAIKGWWQF